MELNRRDFLKLSGAGAGATVLLGMLPKETQAKVPRQIPLKKNIGEKTSICAYCAGGCGVIVSAEGDKLIGIEGDPEHPVNRGALCSKAQSLYQIRMVDGKINPRRVTKVLYRAPNDDKWQEKTWDWAVEEIARRVKKTRDINWIEKEGDLPVRRTEAVAMIGASPLDNEECYLITKINRALGLVYTETQARL